MLKIEKLTKIYGKRKLAHKALDGIDLTFPETGFVVILGKSGCGKSTFLNIVGGLDRPTSGEVYINGKGISTLTEKQLDDYRNTYVGFVFQNFNIIENRTVYENIELTLKLQNNEEDVNYIDDVLNTVGLSGLGYRKPSELSGGQRQKVAIARALIKNPDVILADEPTGSLDSQSGDDLFASLKKLSKTKLVIVVTHDTETAFRYGDRIISMADGKIIDDVDRKRVLQNENIVSVRDNITLITAGHKLSLDEANGLLTPDKDNYLTFESSRNNVVLAYPDTIDSVDEGYKPGDFTPHGNDSDLPEKPFKLKRAVMSVKNCLDQAFSNVKKRKRKFINVLVISILCMILFEFGLTFALTNEASLVANTVRDNQMDFLTGESSYRWYYDYENNAYEGKSTLEFFSEYNPGLCYPIPVSYFPVTKYDANTSFYTPYNYQQYGTSLNGIVEFENFENSDIKLFCGEYPASGKDCLISDYIADKLVAGGYVTFDGEYKIIQPKSRRDCVGKCFFANSEFGPIVLNISGIIDTNYELHKEKSEGLGVLEQYEYDSYADEMITEYYTAIYTFYGFTEDLIKTSAKSSFTPSRLSINGIYGDQQAGIVVSDCELINATVPDVEYLYLKDGITPGDTLPKTEIILSDPLAQNIYYYFKDKLDSPDEYKDFFENCTIEINGTEVKVVGVLATGDQDLWYHYELYCDKEFIFTCFDNDRSKYDVIIPTAGLDARAITAKIRNSEFDVTSPLFYSVKGTYEDLDVMKTVFFVLAGVLAFFVFITVLNFISILVKERNKEIGIMRALGASNNVTLKVFYIELIALDIIVMSVSSILVALALNSAGSSFGLISMILFGSSSLVTFIKFSFPVVLLAVLIFTLLLLITAYPFLGRLRKKQPIDIITSI